MINYPSNPETAKTVMQNNRTNVFPLGNTWSTMGIDLQSNLGTIRVTPRLKVNTSTATQADLGCPITFKYFDSRIFSIAGTKMFVTASFTPDSAFSPDAAGTAPTDFSSDYSDMDIFNQTLVVATNDELLSKASNGSGSGAYTSRTTLTGSVYHAVRYFRNLDRVYFFKNNETINSMDTAWTEAVAGDDFSITLNRGVDQLVCMEMASADTWIGTMDITSSGAYGSIYRWDGLSAQPTNQYKLKANGCMAMVILDQTPYAFDSNGVLSAFTGYAFEEVGRLPFGNLKPWGTFNLTSDRYVHPNGMYITKNGTIRVAINNSESNANPAENLPSGIWEWSKDKGFVHVQPLTYNPVGSPTITDYGQNQISRIGALASMATASSNTADGTLLMGATYYTNATATTNAIFVDNSLDTIQKKGYFVTDFYEAKGVAASWDVIWATFKKLAVSTDGITFKYRTDEVASVQGTITWVNTTSFTILNSAVDVSLYWTSGDGGEVEIVRGTGGAVCAHITNSVNNAGTWTVTIDEIATGATTGTAVARFQKWIKVHPSEVISTITTWAQWAISTDSVPRIQIKGCFTYTGQGELWKSIITSNEDIKSK